MNPSFRIYKNCLLLPLILVIFFPTLSRSETISAFSSPPRAYFYKNYLSNYLPPSPILLPPANASAVKLKGIPPSFESVQDKSAIVIRQSEIVNSQDASDWVKRSLSEDRWIALDKLAHLLVSFSLVGMGFAASSERGLGFDRNQARILAAGGTALIGVAKEIRDYQKGSDFCGKDLTADGLGLTLGILFFTF
jgi:uncharacterized protein YfiM (DUF2279 family)